MYVRQVTDLSTRLERATLTAGTTLGRYRLVDRNGEGGHGRAPAGLGYLVRRDHPTAPIW